MKNTLNVKVLYHFYHSAVKAELKRRGFSKDVSGKINEEHKKIIREGKRNRKIPAFEFLHYGNLFHCNEPEYRKAG